MGRIHSYSELTTKALLVATVVVGFSACTKDLYDPSANGENPWKIGEVTLDNYYDFATTKSVQLNIDYGKECAGAHFKIYAENPFEVKENQVVRRKDLDLANENLMAEGLVAVASGFTNVNGVYKAKVSITSSVSKVYICSSDFGVPTLYIADVVGDKISAKITFANAVDLTTMVNNTVTRAATNTITKNIPNTLGNWDSKGMPRYLDNSKSIAITTNLKNYITSHFAEGGDNAGKSTLDDPDLFVAKAANVWVNYFGGTTGAQSVFAYYCYKVGTSPELAAKNACVIFPSAHSSALGDYSGVAVKLKYIDQNGNIPTENPYDFPKDTKVGFLIWNNGWTNGNGGAFANNVFYSTASLNRDKRSHTAVFGAEDNGKSYNVITMEDWTDSDYNDVAFVVQSNPIDAIVVPPIAKPDDREGTDTYRGLLGFEDNWPYQGDYDMNDVVMKYLSNIEYNFDNNVIGLVDKFTLSWTGANLKNGFAYEVPFDLSKAKVTVTGGDHYNVDALNNVITLFNDAKTELGVSGIDAKDMPNHAVKEVFYTVSIQFNNGAISIPKDKIVSPYNPFIKRGKSEIHLTNYKPSPLADNVFDKRAADISDGKNTYYVCKDGFPFAIHLDARVDASILNVNLKKEGERIDKIYPSFAEWALTRNPSIQWWKK